MAGSWIDTIYTLLDKGKERGIPVAGSFELTTRCNLGCKMCYVCQPANNKEAMARERTAFEWLRLAEGARDAGVLFITLTGGEIFLRKDIREIYSNMLQMGFRIVLYTNGTLITPEIAKWLARNVPAGVFITLYGASRETYGKVCGDPEGFDRVVKGINSLLAEGIKPDLRNTVIRYNAGEYDRIAEMADKWGLSLETVEYISPRREGCYSDPQDVRLLPAELVAYKKHVEECNRIKNLAPVSVIDRKAAIDTEAFRESVDAFRCAAGKCGFWVTWDGRLIPCGMLDIPETYPFEAGFTAAWEELKEKIKAIPGCTACKECEYLPDCSYCPAKLRLETGFFDKPASYICEWTKQSLLSRAAVNR